MALRVTFIFICAGLTGIQSISTVRHVAVEVGDIVHIPCKYEDKYKTYVKYLCRGSTWGSCKYEIKTNQINSAKYSISDDKNQRIVTFTIKNLRLADDDYYWCNIDKTGTDDGERFRVSVTSKGESKLHVDSQWITGYSGDQVVVYCNYRGSGPKQWCRVGGDCVSTSGQIDGALVTTDTSASGMFAVTMTGLFQQNIGWYWCSSGDLQMPVFVDVTVRPTIITVATTTTATIATTTTATIATTTTATMEPTPTISTNEPGKKSVSDHIIVAVIALGLLILIAVVSVVVWFMLKRNIKNTEGSQSEKDQEVVYSDIIIRSQSSSNRKKSADDPVYSNVTLHQNPCADKEMESYSSVRFINTQASKKVTAKEEDVVYSTLATQ